MKDESKAKKQLIAELAEMRQRIAELEVSEIERQQMMEALRESETRWRSLVENSPDHILALDSDLRILSVNHPSPGLTVNDLIGAHLYTYVAQERQAEIKKLLQDVLDTDRPARYETQYDAPDGTIHYESHVIPRKLENKIVGLALTARDITERKQMEEALGESERRLSTLMCNLPGMVYRCLNDWSWTMKFVSQGALELTGYSPEQLLDNEEKSYGDLIHPDDRKNVWDGIQSALEIQEPFQLTYRIISASGEEKWVWEQGRGILDATGQVIALEGFIIDITERKQAEEALRESEERYRSLFENMIEGFAYCKIILENDQPVDFIYLDVNDALERQTGLKDVVGKKVTEVVPGIRESSPELFDIYGRVALTGKPERFETYLDTLEMWLSISVYSPEKEYFVAVFDVITERKRLAIEIEAERNRLASLVASIPDEVWFADAQKVFTLANPSAVREFKVDLAEGVEVEELARGLEVLRPDGSPRPVEEAPPLRALAGEVVRNQEEIVRTPASGELRYRQVNAAPVRDANGHIIGSVSVVRDITERKQAEEALRERERILNATGRMGKIGGWEHDFVTGKAVWTQALYDIIEIPYDQEPPGVGEHLSYYPPQDLKMLEQAYNQAVKNGTPFDLELQVYTSKKKLVWCRVQGEPVYKNGKCVAMRGTFQNITERKQAEEALRESEEKFSAAFRSSPTALAITTLDGKYVEVNQAFCDLVGYSREEIIGKTVTDLGIASVQDREKLVTTIESAGGSVSNAEVKFHVRDGSLRDILYSLETISLHGVPHRLSTGLDVTERKQTEEALRESERRYRLLAENVTDVIWTVDMNLQPTYTSPSVMHLRGYSAEEATAQTLEEVLTPASLEAAMKALEEELAIASMPQKDLFRTRTLELENTCKDGSTVWAEVRMAFLRDPDGRPVEILGVSRDITERMRMEKELRQQERLAAVGQLAGGIAHDFNNLLTTIMLYAQMGLGKKGDLAPDLTRAFETILDESRQAARLVQQVLDFSRRSPMETHPVDLKPFVKEAVRVLQRTIPESIPILLEVGPEEYVVDADPTRIQQVLMNLVVNARDVMPEGGVLRIDLSRVEVSPGEEPPVTDMIPGEWVCLAVTDTGTGIPPEVLPHVFEPFFTTKEPGKGTGLGLAQVYGIVMQHGGHVEVETEVGRGTTFRVYLLAYQAGEEVPQEEVALAAPQGRGETILLVEDNERLREIIQGILDSLGYRVLTATNGREALEIYRSVKGISLLLTDVVMPEMGGKELMRELRKTDPDLKALAITGYLLAEDLEALKEAGILDVVHKPLDVNALAQVVRTALDAD